MDGTKSVTPVKSRSSPCESVAPAAVSPCSCSFLQPTQAPFLPAAYLPAPSLPASGLLRTCCLLINA